MSRHRYALGHRRQRPVLTDMLPFEVPPTFSNRGFYRFLRDNGVVMKGGRVEWVADSGALDVTMCLLFGLGAGEPIGSKEVSEWGKPKKVRSFAINKCRMDTIPFNFQVAHNVEGRTLSVVHPRNQVAVANFYASHGSLIIYHTSRGEFSIRRPVSVSRYAYYRDRLHEERLDRTRDGVEEEGAEYEQLGSYFVYRKYRNIHKFFESYKYHRSEKKYSAMTQIDVSKCFDSIYTHSLPWALIGKPQTKFYLDESKGTFGGKFDALMQNLNHKETNGIVIGPEFSRIFAEMILQSVDVDLQARLQKVELAHKVDYEIFRYVDDYFVFYNEGSTHLKVVEVLQECLKAKKLAINPAKIKVYEKPIITEITIAKEKISSLLNAAIDPQVVDFSQDDGTVEKRLSSDINANRLIVRYKSSLKESGATYGDLLNYTLAILENKLEDIINGYLESSRTPRNQKSLVRALVSLLEFSFFVYSASPKVNHTIRISRLIVSAADFLTAQRLPCDMKHIVFKYVHDNIMQQLSKNTMRPYREVETLYLLVALTKVGRAYWLPESTLLKHFMIELDKKTNTYVRVTTESASEFMSHFAITVLLTYMRDKKRYDKLRDFLKGHILTKLEYSKAHCPNDAEAMLLLLDLVVCPWLDSATKAKIGDIFGLDAAKLAAVQASNGSWFTVWGQDFDLGKELDAKRSREVY